MKEEKQLVSFSIDRKLIERVRNAVYYTPGWSVTKMIIRGLIKELEILEEKNKGEFAERPTVLRGEY